MSIATVRVGTKTTGPGKFNATTPLRLEKEHHLTRAGRQKCIFVADGSNTQRDMTRYDLHMRAWRVFVERLGPIRQHDGLALTRTEGAGGFWASSLATRAVLNGITVSLHLFVRVAPALSP
jgi:hypothetical protein